MPITTLSGTPTLMCADHRNRAELDQVLGAVSQLRIPLRFPNGLPNVPPRDSIRITDPALVVRQPSPPGTLAARRA